MTRNQTFRGLDPKAQDVLGSILRDAERDIEGLIVAVYAPA